MECCKKWYDTLKKRANIKDFVINSPKLWFTNSNSGNIYRTAKSSRGAT